MLPKACVFCGSKPQNKSKEHILPRWLIELTGDPNRKGFFGRDWTKDGLPERIYSFSSFTFPACSSCNDTASALEAKAKNVVLSMLRSEAVSDADIDVLLDWFDKVRTGLWLGYTYLNKNFHGVDPQYYITSRIASRDRILFVYRDAESSRFLTFAGPESPIFQIMPTCLVLRVNHLHFFNASTLNLVAERIGFPYIVNRRLVSDRQGELADFNEGTRRISVPPVPFHVYRNGALFFQSIIPPEALRNKDILKEYYENDYVRSYCMYWGTGRSVIFHARGATLRPYPLKVSRDWLTSMHDSGHVLFFTLALLNGQWLDAMFSALPSTEDLSKDQMDYICTKSEMFRRLHATMMEIIRNQLALIT